MHYIVVTAFQTLWSSLQPWDGLQSQLIQWLSAHLNLTKEPKGKRRPANLEPETTWFLVCVLLNAIDWRESLEECLNQCLSRDAGPEQREEPESILQFLHEMACVLPPSMSQRLLALYIATSAWHFQERPPGSEITLLGAQHFLAGQHVWQGQDANKDPLFLTPSLLLLPFCFWLLYLFF